MANPASNAPSYGEVIESVEQLAIAQSGEENRETSSHSGQVAALNGQKDEEIERLKSLLMEEKATNRRLEEILEDQREEIFEAEAEMDRLKGLAQEEKKKYLKQQDRFRARADEIKRFKRLLESKDTNIAELKQSVQEKQAEVSKKEDAIELLQAELIAIKRGKDRPAVFISTNSNDQTSDANPALAFRTVTILKDGEGFFGMDVVQSSIARVTEGSPASENGIAPGDQIVSVNGENVDNLRGLEIARLLRVCRGDTELVLRQDIGLMNNLTGTHYVHEV